MGYDSDSASQDGRDEDDDEEYEEAGGSNRLLGFMFGNVDNAGDLDVDYLDEDAKEHLAALADKLGPSLTALDLSVKSPQTLTDPTEQDYDEKAEDAVNYEDISEQYEGPETQAATEEDYLLPKKEFFSAEASVTTLAHTTSVFDDENYDEDEEFEREHEMGDNNFDVQTASISGEQAKYIAIGTKSPEEDLQVESLETEKMVGNLANFQEEHEVLDEPFDNQSSTSLPILCIEDGMVILRFSEIFGTHESKKKEKRDQTQRIPKERNRSMDAFEIVEDDEEAFLKGSCPGFSVLRQAHVTPDDILGIMGDKTELEEFGAVLGGPAIPQQFDGQRMDSCRIALPMKEDMAVDLSVAGQSPFFPEFYALDQQDWEDGIIWDNSPAVSDGSAETYNIIGLDSETLVNKNTELVSDSRSQKIFSEHQMVPDEKDHRLFLCSSSVNLESFGSRDPGNINLAFTESRCHPQVLRLDSRLELDDKNHSDAKGNATEGLHHIDSIRQFSKLTLQNRDILEGSWLEEIIWDPHKPVAKPKLILDLQDEQMVFEILDGNDSNNFQLHARAMIVTRSMKSGTGDPSELPGHGGPSGGRFNIANDKYYSNRKISQQLKSHSKKRAAHGIKVLHSIPAVKLQTMKPKLSNKDVANFHCPKALWYPHDNEVAVKEQGKLPTQGPMKIILKSLGGKGSKLHVDAEETVSSVKMKASKKLDFKASEIVKIFYSGKELEEQKSISEQNVQPNSLLHLVRTKLHLLPRAQKLPGENKSLRPPGAFKKKSDLSVKDGHVFLMELFPHSTGPRDNPRGPRSKHPRGTRPLPIRLPPDGSSRLENRTADRYHRIHPTVRRPKGGHPTPKGLPSEGMDERRIRTRTPPPVARPGRENIERLEITGVGDPSGRGLGFSYVRTAPRAPISSAVMKKKAAVGRGGSTVTGTDADLRRLSMEAAREVLLKFNVPDEQIAKQTRWHRIAMIRKLSSEQAASGIKVDPTNISKYARGQRMSFLQFQQQTREKCQEIWDRQTQNLSSIDVDENASDSEANSDLDSFAGDLENLLDAECEEGEEGNYESKHDKVGGVRGFKMRRHQYLAQAEEEIEDEAAEAAELCRMLMDDDEADWKKKMTIKAVREEALLGGSQSSFGFETAGWIKKSSAAAKPISSKALPEGYYAPKNIVDPKNVESLFPKKKMFRKGKTMKKNDVAHTGLVHKKVKIMADGDGVKIVKEKKSARETFVCGACGQLGHMRTNKNCPKYGEDLEMQNENIYLEKASSKSNLVDASAQPQQKPLIKKLIPKGATKIVLVEANESENFGSKPKFLPLKFKCGGSENPDNIAPVIAPSSERPVSSDVETGNKSTAKVNKIIISNKMKPEEVHIESHKPSIVIRPPAEIERDMPRKKIVIKRPKEIINLDHFNHEGSAGPEFRKTKKIVELSKHGEQNMFVAEVTKRKAREDKRWWEEEKKRRHAERQRGDRARKQYEEEMRMLEEQDRLAEIRRYEEAIRREREEEEHQKAKKKKKKKRPQMKNDYLEDFRSRRNDRRLAEWDQTAKRRPVFELGSYSSDCGPPTKRRRGGEVGLANILERIVESLKDAYEVSYLFLKPVSKKEAPDYLHIIKRPMDLSTIKEKVRKMEYKSREEFRHDVWQISYNAHEYNIGRNPGIPPLAKQLLELCDYLLEEYNTSLTEAEAGIENSNT
ncbi:transcription initiation factor TFIID subunit 1-like [Malania oleifera]|uniref:transcription initiation factor TFIID subunit 1-like n=1 Tax=Malania oleifera TaxID=397392 RepID=UPI0025ADD76C|nr:transcription initiation factor TFIID subunit 1-like [Malania oleifera]